MNKTGIEIEVLRHAEAMVGNTNLNEKSRYRREGIRIARRVLQDLIAIRMDKLLSDKKKCFDPELHEIRPCDCQPPAPAEGKEKR